jgi:predicted MFS family arabinose efflux permease
MAPLGICLGTFMPLGLGAVAGLTQHSREYVAWGWAVNGFASVIGAVLTTILAMAFGFRTVLFIALAVYVVALVALRTLLRAEPVTPSLRGADVG